MTTKKNMIDIESLLHAHTDGYSLEQDFYLAPEMFDHDMSQVLSRRWLLVDHESRIPSTGDYFLFEVGAESIIIIRDKERQVNAFFNVCRHRGSRICSDLEGNRSRLTCPYHAWTYTLEGELRQPPLMPSNFDKSEFSLHTCHTRVFHGLIFICLTDDKPPDFDREFGEFSDILDFHGFSQAKIAVKRDYPNACNWKLVVENFVECYHCGPAHKEYCSVHPKDQLLALGAGPGSGPAEALKAYQPTWDAWKENVERLGHPLPEFENDEHSLHMSQLCRIPINDKSFDSETRDGSLGCKKLMGQFKECDQGETAIVFNPVSYILASNDFAMMARFTPRDVVNTDVQLSWLVHEDAEAGEDYDPDNIAWLWDTTIIQDKKITENNHAGVLSSRYQPGRYSTQESMVVQFIRWYLNAIS